MCWRTWYTSDAQHQRKCQRERESGKRPRKAKRTRKEEIPAREEPPTVFFGVKRRTAIAKLFFAPTHDPRIKGKIYWRRPARAGVSVYANERARESYTERRLDTIHPNPGPRDKTEEGKKRRREHRYKTRAEKRKKKEKVN